jgi:hypothetical protein
MNYAKLETSHRLRNVFKVLNRNSKPQSTMDLIKKSGHCAINSIISELRENGVKINCTRSGNAWYYKLNN